MHIESVTRWLDYMVDIWPFTTIKFYKHKKLAKIGFKFCQIPNKNLKICSNTLQMSQNGVFRQIQSHCTVHITHNFRNLKIFHQDEDPEGGHEPPPVVRRVHDQENDEGDDNDDINDQSRKLVRH